MRRDYERHFQTFVLTGILGLVGWTLLTVTEVSKDAAVLRVSLTSANERLAKVEAGVERNSEYRFQIPDILRYRVASDEAIRRLEARIGAVEAAQQGKAPETRLP